VAPCGGTGAITLRGLCNKVVTREISFAGHFRTLERQRIALERLATRISRYKPRLTKLDEQRRRAKKKRVRELNPGISEARVDELIDVDFVRASCGIGASVSRSTTRG
jgi:hypothetical protein